MVCFLKDLEEDPGELDRDDAHIDAHDRVVVLVPAFQLRSLNDLKNNLGF